MLPDRTPTVVLFGSVLPADCLLVLPRHTTASAAPCVCLVGALGLAHTASTLLGASMLVGGGRRNFERRDLLICAGVPFAVYGPLALGGAVSLYDAQLGLALVAVSLLALLTSAFATRGPSRSTSRPGLELTPAQMSAVPVAPTRRRDAAGR